MAESPKATARRLLREANVAGPPVPVEALVEHVGAELSYRSLEGDISGLLYRDEGRQVIGVNALDGRARQRFTIAHEIGHLLLHPGHTVIIDKLVKVNFRATASMPVARRHEEREANEFAAELLMPERLVKSFASDIVGASLLFSKDDLVRALAQRFDVSPLAMEYRLVNLDLLDGLAVQGG